MTVAGKEERVAREEDDEAAARTARRKAANRLLQHVSLNVVAQTMPAGNVMPSLAAELHGGDYAEGAKFIGATYAGAAFLEFFFNPSAGRWSDANGRKFGSFI